MNRTIIGEGAYGCVHKPSIHCKTPPRPGFNYTNYVSKIMTTKNAKKELSEFLIIKNIDPTNEYHLGSPILCRPNIDNKKVTTAIDKCKYIKLNDVQANPDYYSLLVLKFGGLDFKVLCNTYLTKYLRTKTKKKTDNFWLEVHHLIKGIKFFKDNGIVHNDIKPQNILFNSNGKMKYIDFGLMRTKKDIINLSKINDNFLGTFHWSYPFDCGFMEKTLYDKYKHFNVPDKTLFKNELSKLIVNNSKVTNSKINVFKLPIHNPSSFKILFTYLNPNNTIPNASTQYGYINSFFNGFNDMIDNKSYDEVLNYIVDSIDVFGLGFTLQFMANCFKRLNALSLQDFTRLSTFFYKMYDFNPLTRVVDIDLLLNEYENILLELGILMRLKKSFNNHILVNKLFAPPIIISKSKSDDKSHPQYLSYELQELANKDPIELRKRCPYNKELNIKTNKCVKKYNKTNKYKTNKYKTNNKTNNKTSKNKTNKQF
jgi:serine/threonine protein kinase